MCSHFILLPLLLVAAGLPVARPAHAQERHYDFVVAQDGSGDFTTIQEAIDAVRDYTPIPRTIFIKSGVYREKLLVPSWKTDIALIGEDVETTIIDYADYSGKGDINTFTSYTARISGSDIHVYNITFRNSAGPVGQALALFVEGDRVVFDNCRFIGNQDTIFAAGEGSRQYFRNTYIEGTTDFIFGPATAYFENCHIHSKKDSYITAASTPREVPYGFVFVNCKLTADPGVSSVYLGRPWRDHARTVFISSELGAHIRPEAWHDWSRPEAQRTTFYAEYRSTGPGARREGRVAWARQLEAGEAERYTKRSVLCAQHCERGPWYERQYVPPQPAGPPLQPKSPVRVGVRIHRLPQQQADVGGWPELGSAAAPTDTDHDGMPDEWEVRIGLDPNDPADRNRAAADGYTMLEKYLNGIEFEVPVGDVRTARISDTSIEVRWADRYLAEEGFVVERSVDGGTYAVLAEVDANVTSVMDDSVTGSRRYEYRVKVKPSRYLR